MNINCKRSGAVLLNSILILSVVILIVGYTSNLIGEQISGYRRLDEIYEQQINKKINKSNKIDYCELTSP
ncbi:hypothetical protein LBO01_15580 [Companilactobacillus paralimentarius]|nr:hypothetical protein LBO01_15580 [Companilactobacillus paralimentarius]